MKCLLSDTSIVAGFTELDSASSISWHETYAGNGAR